MRIGESKYEAKKEGVHTQYIYSYTTLKNYMRHCNYFAKYCKENYGCKTLTQCRPYIREYMETRKNLSAFTQKLDLSALAKLYSESSTTFGVETPPRTIDTIKRSRGNAKRDKNFNEKNHKEFVEFCRSTGLRRNELKYLRGNMFEQIDGQYYLNITKGTKGGKPRKVLVIGDIDNVVALMHKAGTALVFPKLPSNADIHSYRAQYALKLYQQVARSISKIPYDKINRGTGHWYQSDVYCCRGSDVKFDRKALYFVSQNLGHNRCSVAATNYLYQIRFK